MQVEAELINRAASSTKTESTTLAAEMRTWIHLFAPKYVDRVMVGIMVMFFQRV